MARSQNAMEAIFARFLSRSARLADCVNDTEQAITFCKIGIVLRSRVQQLRTGDVRRALVIRKLVYPLLWAELGQRLQETREALAMNRLYGANMRLHDRAL
ncbi:MAG: hypothetical protein V4637_00075, partial [Pseudomonadota bacterium]